MFLVVGNLIKLIDDWESFIRVSFAITFITEVYTII